jgi:streptogramin lyase
MTLTPATMFMLTTLITLLVLPAAGARAATKDLGGGFADHGVASPFSQTRGTVATIDGAGRNVVLVWLFDHRGGYALLVIDADTGRSEQFPMPFPAGDAPYASVLSSGNKLYTHFNSHFVEFDPAKRAFTFFQKTTPQMAMGMTEDDDGVIWSVTYPQSGVVSFDPKTRAFKDYGHVYKQNWAQYQRYVAADDAGWIYVGLGSAASQILAFDPASGQATPIVPEAERAKGTAYVYRDLNGRVYGQDLKDAGQWYELYRGSAARIDKPATMRPKPIITGNQGLFHAVFPDGRRVTSCDLIERRLIIEDTKTGTTKAVEFTYESDGAGLMGVAAAPDGTISGGTFFPFRFFSYDPRTDQWVNRRTYGQYNTVARQGDRLFFGGYGGGFLAEWDPASPWRDPKKGDATANPAYLFDCTPTIHRPHELLAHPDGKTLIMGGTPEYGYTGGGLLFWDRESRTRTLLSDADVVPDQSTTALSPLPDGKLLGGTTTSPGSGGEKKAAEAELYLMDMATKSVEWHAAVIPGVQQYTDLYAGPGGLVFGIADRKTFFVFDAPARKLVHQRAVDQEFGPSVGEQGPRVFVPTPDGQVYLLFAKAIVRLDPATFTLTKVAEPPVTIDAGGDYLDGRIYFRHSSHLCSYDLGP